MSSVSSSQVTGWTGIVFVVMAVFTFFVGSPFDAPALADPAAEWTGFFVENDDGIAVQTWFGVLTFGALFLLFASGVRGFLREADAEYGIWSRWSFSGAIAAGAIGAAGMAFFAAASHSGVLSGADDQMFRLLGTLDAVTFGVIVPWGLAIFVAGASMVIVQSGVLPRWVGLLGLVTALLTAAGTSWIMDGDEETVLAGFTLIGYLLTLIWSLAVSVTMLTKKAEVLTAG